MCTDHWKWIKTLGLNLKFMYFSVYAMWDKYGETYVVTCQRDEKPQKYGRNEGQTWEKAGRLGRDGWLHQQKTLASSHAPWIGNKSSPGECGPVISIHQAPSVVTALHDVIVPSQLMTFISEVNRPGSELNHPQCLQVPITFTLTFLRTCTKPFDKPIVSILPEKCLWWLDWDVTIHFDSHIRGTPPTSYFIPFNLVINRIFHPINGASSLLSKMLLGEKIGTQVWETN